MQRYWISFWSGYYKDEGCTQPPFQFWISGYRDRNENEDMDDILEELSNLDLASIKETEAISLLQKFKNRAYDSQRDECSICAVVESNSIDEIWEAVKKHFPDYEERFCDKVANDWEPNDRFPDFKNKVSLTI